MSNEPVITIVGNLASEPELRFTSSGAAVASFTVVSNSRTFDKNTNSWKDSDSPLFMRCSVWRQYAENLAESGLSKGMQVIVQGRLKQRSYEKDGQQRTVIELDVEDVGPTLRFATAKVVKAQRGNGGSGGQQGGNGGDWGSSQSAGVQRSGGQRPGPAQDDPWAAGGGRGGYSQEPPF